jgi:hypothetical protein
VYGKDIGLLELIASYYDNKRAEHVEDAIAKGSLPYLEVVLRVPADVGALLSETLFTEAARVGNMPVWEFLAQKSPDRARCHQNLRVAVKNQSVEVVRHILAN